MSLSFTPEAIAAALGESSDGIETEKEKALDVQLTRVVLIVDHEYERSPRRVRGTTAIHGSYSVKNSKIIKIPLSRATVCGVSNKTKHEVLSLMDN